MAVDFRCEKCGKLLSLDARPGEETKCPHCLKKITVPAGLASLPRPQVPPNAAREGAQAGEEEGGALGEQDPVMNVLAQVMPWVISVFFHLGLVLITMFIAIIVIDEKTDKSTKRPDATVVPKRDRVTRKIPKTGYKNAPKRPARQPLPSLTRGDAQVKSDKLEGTGLRGKTSAVIGTSGAGTPGGKLAATGPRRFGGGGAGFFGATVKAEDIVYVIDKSGSMEMEGAFDTLRVKLAQSIGGLNPTQHFHLIFFGPRTPLEMDVRRLVPATEEAKIEVARFLDGLVAEGQTIVLPALERAFAVLRQGESRAEKLIFLLSDAGFESYGRARNEYRGLVGNEAVKAWLDEHNRKVPAPDGTLRREVRIFTFLYRGKDPEAVKLMKQIAADHDGEFHMVGQD
jgi:DNA-directed RNA polymerase subunit RPC12/RpoP